MIPPIPPTPPQTGAPPPLGAPPPMAPPMGAPMPPMPPSPMGKGLGSMLNTDPMARSNFSMMLSNIQNQSMIPPMPMHMNEGGLVGFIQNLLKGIGGLFRGGGGQQGGSGSLGAFERAFAEARAKGLKTFPFDRNGDGVDEIYTTRYENEPIEGQTQTEKANVTNIPDAMKEGYRRDVLRRAGPERLLEIQAQGETAPTSAMRKRDSVADLLRQAQQSRRDTPKFGNEFDVQGANKDSEAFANRLEQIKKEIERENYRRDVSERAGPEKLLEMMAQQRQMEADQSKAPTSNIEQIITDLEKMKYEDVGAYPDSFQMQDLLKNNMAPIVEEGNIVDVIQDRLEKLTNVSGDQPNLPEGLTEGVKPMGLGEKIESLYQSGLRNIGNVKEEASNLASRIKELNESLNNRENIVGKIRGLMGDLGIYRPRILGMTEGGNPMVEKLKAIIAESANPQQKLQEMFSTFREAKANDEDVSQLLKALEIIQQSPEFMNEATRSSLLGTMPPQPKERVSDNVMGRKFGLQKDFYDELKNLIIKNPFMDAQIRLNIKKPPEGMSPIESAMGVTGAPRYVFTPEVKELLGLSNGGSVTDAIAKLERGRQIVNKNQGGAINASNLGMMQNMGMSSGDNIQRLLYPLTKQIHRSYMQENDSDIKKKLDEFTQQVDQLTKSTFPDVSFQNQNTGLGSMPQIGFGGVPTGTRQFGVYNPNDSQFINESTVFNPFQNFVRTSDVKPNDINTFASSPFGNSLGSFFQNKFQNLQGYNLGGIVNPDRINEIMAVMNKYAVNGVVDGNNPDYQAEVKAIVDKYENMEAQGGDSQQAPAFLPGQQGDSPFAGSNLPPESLVNETATEVEDEPMKVFSYIGSQGQGQGYQTIQDVIKDLGGATGTVERLYFKDPETGRVFNYDYDDKEFEGLGPGYYGKSLSDLQLVSGISKDRNGENVRFQVDDPSKYDVSGVLGYDPETTEAMAIEQKKDDKSDNDIFYTAPNGQTFVDVSGTGESIPVGSYNIVRGNEALSQYYSVDEEGNRIGNITGSGANFVQPALTKTETGYVATDSDEDPFEKNEDGVVSEESIQNHLTGDSFNIGGLEFTNPASNQINLEPFFNAVESSGGLNQFLYSQQDKLPNYKQILDYLTGKINYEDIDFDPSGFFNKKDGSVNLSGTDLTNTLNEYLTGQDSEGNTSNLFGNTFDQITESNVFDNNGGDSSVDDSVDDDSTGDGDDSDDNGGDETTPKTLFNFKDLYTNTEPMEDIIARTVVDSPVSSEGMGTFSPIESSVVYNPDMFTDFSFPDASDMTIRDNENPFEDDTNIPMPIVTPDPGDTGTGEGDGSSEVPTYETPDFEALAKQALSMNVGLMDYNPNYDINNDGKVSAGEALQIYKGEYNPLVQEKGFVNEARGQRPIEPIPDEPIPDPGTPPDPGEPDPGTLFNMDPIPLGQQPPPFLPGEQGVEGVNNLPPNDNQQLPPFLPGEQGDNPFAGTNLPPSGGGSNNSQRDHLGMPIIFLNPKEDSPFRDSGKPISELETFKVPDQQTDTANMNMGGMPSNGDVISKFLAMDIDKRPLSKTPKVKDMSTLTASIKMNEGGEVTAGMNKAIDTFLASMM